MALESPLELDLRTGDYSLAPVSTPAVSTPAPSPAARTPDVRTPVVRCRDGSIRTAAGCPEDRPAGGDDRQSLADIIAGIGGGGGGASPFGELPQEGVSLAPVEGTRIPPAAILLALAALAAGGYYLYKRSKKAQS